MKSIAYHTSILGFKFTRYRPTLIEHLADSNIPDDWQDKHLHDTHLRWLGCARADLTIHERINHRAELLHNIASTGRRETPSFSMYCHYYSSPERIARSRFRNGKKKRKHSAGYAIIDWSYGLDHCSHLDSTQFQHLKNRLHLAATSRAPLPPWSMNDCLEGEQHSAAA